MIYEFPDKSQPVKQGDIFYPLPLILLDLNKMAISSKSGTFEEANWQIIKDKKDIVVNTPIRPVWGVVATQECDASRAPIISLFGIGIFKDVTGLDVVSNDMLQ